MKTRRIIGIATVFAFCGGLSSAFAGLGEPYRAAAAAIGTTPSGARFAAVRPAAAAPYQTQETVLPNGASVLEFTDLQGIVFAVAWQGPTLPGLRELLGNYFAAFKSATDQARANGQGRSAVNLRLGGLVLRSTGRMRAFEGFAYAPGLVPAGVNIDDVLP